MGRFYDRYLKDPAHPERYREQAVNYICSLILGKEFGEDAEEYFKRNPDIAKRAAEARQDRDLLDGVIAERQRQHSEILRKSLMQAEQLSASPKKPKSTAGKPKKRRSVCKI